MQRQRRFSAAEAFRKMVEENSSDSDESEENESDGSESDAVVEDPDSEMEMEMNIDEIPRHVHGDVLQNSVSIENNVIISKDGQQRWSKVPLLENNHVRPRSYNILRERQGPTQAARNVCGLSPDHAFKLLMSCQVVKKIVDFTNLEGQRRFPYWMRTSVDEMYRFFGVLLMAGAFHDNKTRVSELWGAEGRQIYNQCMSRNRFTELVTCIRFDDRRQRNLSDKFSPLRNIFSEVVTNFKSAYKAGCSVTVDEQLVKFRGRCPFKMYIPSKPGKYGIKLWALADAETFYCLNLLPYIGRTGNVPERQQGQRVVLELTDMLTDSGRNVYMDNFFSSLLLARTLLGRQLTMTGTIRKNKPELPKEMLPNPHRAIKSSNFGFQKDVAIVSYVPKRNKAVILISTQFLSNDIAEEEHKKPKAILEYNHGKGGVDSLDQLLRTYNCIRKCNRWSMVLFMNLLNIAAYNALVLYLR